MTGWIGYEPGRLAELRRRAVEAVDDLRAITSADPSATAALQAVRLAREHLEIGLLRYVDGILASEAMATWRGSGLARARLNHGPFADLDDDELLDEYGRAMDVVSAALRESVDGATWVWLRTVLDELRLRADGDPRFRERLDVEYTQVIERLAFTLDASAVQPSTVNPPGEVFEAAAELLAVAAEDDEVAERLGQLAFDAPTLGHLLPLAAFPAPVMVAIARRVLDRSIANEGLDPQLTRAAALSASNSALRALRRDPGAALDFLQDREVVRRLLTSDLDQENVEWAIVLGLGTAVHDDPARLGDGLDALTHVVAVADDETIGAGGARGLAAALGVYLPLFTDLQRHSDVRISADTADPDTAVTKVLGSYDAVQHLLQQVVSDEQAQLTLGVVAREHTTSVMQAAAAQLPSAVTEELANGRLTGALVPQAEFLGMVLGAVDAENSQRVAARAAMIAGATDTIRNTGSIVGLIPVPLAQGVSKVASPAASLFDWVLSKDEPEPVPDTGIVELAHMDLDFDLVDLAVGDSGLARAYTLTPTARRVIGDYAARYRDADEIGTKADLHNQMRSYLRDLPDESLHSAQNVIAAASGFDD